VGFLNLKEFVYYLILKQIQIIVTHRDLKLNVSLTQGIVKQFILDIGEKVMIAMNFVIAKYQMNYVKYTNPL
jgi:hypothetical protein